VENESMGYVQLVILARREGSDAADDCGWIGRLLRLMLFVGCRALKGRPRCMLNNWRDRALKGG
jgi:hypothetical protein